MVTHEAFFEFLLVMIELCGLFVAIFQALDDKKEASDNGKQALDNKKK